MHPIIFQSTSQDCLPADARPAITGCECSGAAQPLVRFERPDKRYEFGAWFCPHCLRTGDQIAGLTDD